MIDLLNIERALGNADGDQPVTLPAKELRMLLADYDLACAVYERWENGDLMEAKDHDAEIDRIYADHQEELDKAHDRIAAQTDEISALEDEIAELEDRLAADVLA